MKCKINITFLVLFIIIQVTPIFSQYSIRSLKPFGLGIYLGGPEYTTSIYLDYYLSPFLNLEIGYSNLAAYEVMIDETIYNREVNADPLYGQDRKELAYLLAEGNIITIHGLHIGLKYFFYGDSKSSGWSPYIGIMPRYLRVFEVSYPQGEKMEKYIMSMYGFYLPVGFDYIGSSGFTFGIEVAYQWINESRYIRPRSSTGEPYVVGSRDGDIHIIDHPNGLWFGVRIGWHFNLGT